MPDNHQKQKGFLMKEPVANITKYKAFFDYVTMIRQTGAQHRGHGLLDHDLLVAQYCLLIAPDEGTGELAWLAAILHSFDRAFGPRCGAELKKAVAFLEGEVGNDEIELILGAVRKHSGKNGHEDDLVLMTLQDADRLANIGPTWIIRMGQHWADLPAMEIEHLQEKNPASTYKQPSSCLDQLRHVLEDWPDADTCPGFGMRLPKAKELSRKYFDFFRQFLALTQMQYSEAGLS
jgi:hypothetical protein